jgi:hypothetical protein
LRYADTTLGLVSVSVARLVCRIRAPFACT